MAGEKELRVINEIAKQYGSIINLEKAPSVLVEILRNYGNRFVSTGVIAASVDASSSVSAIIGGVQTSGSGGAVSEPSLSDIVRGILQLQRAVSAIDVQMKDIVRLNRVTSRKSNRAVQSGRRKVALARVKKKRS